MNWRDMMTCTRTVTKSTKSRRLTRASMNGFHKLGPIGRANKRIRQTNQHDGHQELQRSGIHRPRVVGNGPSNDKPKLTKSYHVNVRCFLHRKYHGGTHPHKDDHCLSCERVGYLNWCPAKGVRGHWWDGDRIAAKNMEEELWVECIVQYSVTSSVKCTWHKTQPDPSTETHINLQCEIEHQNEHVH